MKNEKWVTPTATLITILSIHRHPELDSGSRFGQLRSTMKPDPGMHQDDRGEEYGS